MGGQVTILNEVVRVGLVERSEERPERFGSLPSVSGRGALQAAERTSAKDPSQESAPHTPSVFEGQGGAGVAGVSCGRRTTGSKVGRVGAVSR